MLALATFAMSIAPVLIVPPVSAAIPSWKLRRGVVCVPTTSTVKILMASVPAEKYASSPLFQVVLTARPVGAAGAAGGAVGCGRVGARAVGGVGGGRVAGLRRSVSQPVLVDALGIR